MTFSKVLQLLLTSRFDCHTVMAEIKKKKKKEENKECEE